jgi:hypothetical protein
MNDVVVLTPMQYLDKAVGALRDIGLMPTKLEPAPINALLEKISDLDPEKIQVIARTLGHFQRGGARADRGHADRRAIQDLRRISACR